MRAVIDLLTPDSRADRVVPPTGFTARLTVFSAGVMGFLAVFAMALAFTADRIADRWSAALSGTATIHVAGPADVVEAGVARVLSILAQTPGALDPRTLSDDEQAELLSPWFGADVPLDALPLPRLIEFRTDREFDAESLRLRLEGEVPAARLDDHQNWRQPLVEAANRLRALGVVSVLLIAGTVATLITLASGSALAANRHVISVLRLIGATDAYIARAFVRRFTFRAFIGAGIGTLAGLAALSVLPGEGDVPGLLTGLRFSGREWLAPAAAPFIAAAIALAATRATAFRTLRELP